ncbi:pseudouridine synthase [Rhizobium panacihumi]|uniref:pseudouridine synthase n=1 Tax=Rhizobium panacihumi TaxID=2008450 RepID=UPI003D7B833C
MSFKDKPKRGGPKPFEREIKPRSNPKPVAAKETPVKKAPRKLPAAPATVEAEGKPERISKILARVGVASRRDIERMIMEGRVTLNGKLLETPVVNVTLEDKIEVDGVPIRGIERTRLWLYHKPAGLVTTNSDPEGRPTVFENLPEDLPRVLSIGRLDINTEGLLLLTNDGGLSRVLELPTTGWLRRYRVRAHGEVDQAKLDTLKDGIAVDGVLYGSIDATLDRTQGRNVWITMGLREGKNREIKNVLGALGLDVNRLIRISYGPFQLGDLEEGRVIEVKGRMLRDQLGPRLIADSKANFDAPIYGNAADAEEAAPAAKPARGERPERGERSDRGDWGRDKQGDRREQALGRLDTRPDDSRSGDRFGDKPRGPKAGGDRGPKGFGAKGPARGGFADRGRDGEGDERPKKRPALGTSRTANVWMAPGARPTTDDKGRKTSARAEAEQLFKKPGPENDRRVVVNRVEGDSDWIRADSPPEPERGDRRGGFGDRPRGDRAERGDRGFGDKPRGERSFGDKPRFDRKPREDGDRPRGERPAGDRPRGDRPYGDRPARGGERSLGDKPRFDRKPREEGDRPRGDRPYGDKPRGERSFGDKPRFDRKPREEGDRPRGDRPFSDRPRGDRPDRGDRPARAFGGEGRSERPAGDRSYGDRPQGDRPRGGKPGGFGGGKPGFGGKPSGGRGKPGGGKSFGGKPSGGKPGGAPRSGGRPGGGKPRTPRG